MNHTSRNELGSFRLLRIRGNVLLDLNDSVRLLAETLRATPPLIRRRNPPLTNAGAMIALITHVTEQHLMSSLIEVLAGTDLTTSVEKRAGSNLCPTRRKNRRTRL
jgi:hypothetical protein